MNNKLSWTDSGCQTVPRQPTAQRFSHDPTADDFEKFDSDLNPNRYTIQPADYSNKFEVEVDNRDPRFGHSNSLALKGKATVDAFDQLARGNYSPRIAQTPSEYTSAKQPLTLARHALANAHYNVNGAQRLLKDLAENGDVQQAVQKALSVLNSAEQILANALSTVNSVSSSSTDYRSTTKSISHQPDTDIRAPSFNALPKRYPELPLQQYSSGKTHVCTTCSSLCYSTATEQLAPIGSERDKIASKEWKPIPEPFKVNVSAGEAFKKLVRSYDDTDDSAFTALFPLVYEHLEKCWGSSGAMPLLVLRNRAVEMVKRCKAPANQVDLNAWTANLPRGYWPDWAASPMPRSESSKVSEHRDSSAQRAVAQISGSRGGQDRGESKQHAIDSDWEIVQ